MKQSSISANLKGFNWEASEILANDAALRHLQEILEPIESWLAQGPDNFTLFFKQTALTDIFTQKIESGEFNWLILNAIRHQAIPEDSVYEMALTKANKKHEIKNHYDVFDELFYLWATEYITSIQDINQLKGDPIWKIRYSGKISGVLYPEDQSITIQDVENLMEQGTANQNARRIRDDIEAETRIVPESTYNQYETTFSPSYDCINQFHIKIDCDTLGYKSIVKVENHPLLSQVIDSMHKYPNFSLEDDLAGVHEVSMPTGAIKNALYQMESTDPSVEIYNRCRAIEYLINKQLISSNLKLGLTLLINHCF